MQARFTRKVQLLTLLSLMLNSRDEDEFAQNEDQFWTLLGEARVIAAGPAGIMIDGAQLIRVCRKIKTKNGTQKGFFKKTKAKEKKMAKKK